MCVLSYKIRHRIHMNGKNRSMEQILKRESVFRGSYLHLQKLKIKLPDGRRGEREIVRVKDAVAVLPVDDQNNVHLVRQYRPAIDRTLVEIPAGLVDREEKIADAAIRECEEETGYRPGVLKKLLYYAHAEGYSTGFVTLFLGTDLECTGNIHLDATEFLEPVCMSFEELHRLVEKNEIVDSKTILCTFLSREWIFRGLIKT